MWIRMCECMKQNASLLDIFFFFLTSNSHFSSSCTHSSTMDTSNWNGLWLNLERWKLQRARKVESKPKNNITKHLIWNCLFCCSDDVGFADWCSVCKPINHSPHNPQVHTGPQPEEGIYFQAWSKCYNIRRTDFSVLLFSLQGIKDLSELRRYSILDAMANDRMAVIASSGCAHLMEY